MAICLPERIHFHWQVTFIGSWLPGEFLPLKVLLFYWEDRTFTLTWKWQNKAKWVEVEAKCQDKRERGTTVNSVDRGGFMQDIKLKFKLKEKRAKLGEVDQTQQNGRVRNKSPKARRTNYVWEMTAAASLCQVSTNLGAWFVITVIYLF